MLGALIAAGASLAGGYLGQKSAEKQADKNIALQKEFAQSGIQWKVADAKAAGVHPLYALGASTHSYAPVSIGTPLADSIGKAGQYLGRAADASSSPSTRMGVMGEQAAKLQLDNMALQNQLLASQIARVNQAGQPPGMPDANQRWLIPGQGQTALPDVKGLLAEHTGGGPGIKIEPFKTSTSAPGGVTEPTAIPDVAYTRTPTGYAPALSKDAQERMEDDWIGQIAHAYRNRILPMMSRDNMVPPSFVKLGPNEKWMWNPFKQEYYIAKKGITY